MQGWSSSWHEEKAKMGLFTQTYVAASHIYVAASHIYVAASILAGSGISRMNEGMKFLMLVWRGFDALAMKMAEAPASI